MPLKERKRRWEALMHGVTNQGVTAWRDSFVRQLTAAGPANDRFAGSDILVASVDDDADRGGRGEHPSFLPRGASIA